MFSIVESFNNLPTNVPDGTMVFVGMDNYVYIFENNTWNKYDDYVGFEEVSSVSLVDDFVSESESFVFSDVPFYDNFRVDNLYYVEFSCDKLTSMDDVNPYDFTIVKSDDSIMFSASDLIRYSPSFKVYFALTQDLSDKEDAVPVRSFAFNVTVSNIIIGGPIKFSVYKSLRAV